METQLAPPYLELGFYFPARKDAHGLAFVVNTLMQHGTRFAGNLYARRGPNIRTSAFISQTDCSPLEQLRVPAGAVSAILEDPNIQAFEVHMHDAIGVSSISPEIVVFNRISAQASLVDHHPIAILTEGEVFSGVEARNIRKRAHEIGVGVYRRFLQLIGVLRPGYAAITVDYALECPADLDISSGSLAFWDFYVAKDYVGLNGIELIRDIYRGCYMEAIHGGFYLSCASFFNPEQRSIDAGSAMSLTSQTAALLRACSKRD